MIYFHRNCVFRYTSKSNIKWKKTNEDSHPPAKKLRRSAVFNFKFQCLFCAGECEINKDPKNPNRWKPAYLFRSIKKDEEKTYKQYLFEKCHSRNDYWANEVQSRIDSAVSDLLAADARYHKKCLSLFISNWYLSEDPNSQPTQLTPDMLYIKW